MGIWLELGIFGVVFVFCFWQLYDVKKAKEQTRLQRKAQADAELRATEKAPTPDTPAP